MIAGTEPTDLSKCIGAIFAVNIPANSANPSWIFGDTFLVCYYSSVNDRAISNCVMYSVRKTCIPSSEPPHHQSASRSFLVWRREAQALEYRQHQDLLVFPQSLKQIHLLIRLLDSQR